VKLLERDGPLGELGRWWSEACDGRGCVALIAGEPGIGKTAVVRELERRISGRVLLGACDPLSTPRPLGPLVDIAPQVGGAVAHHLAAGDRVDIVFAALVAELAAASAPTLLVLEDMHWADAASLDLLRFLGRRIGRLRSMVVVTYRRDELGSGHPLRITLGDLASSDAVRRIALEPLSLDAVRQLAAGSAIDAGDLHRRTRGNPFFVTEVLAEPGAPVPATVRDAAMAHAARLTGDERAALEAMAVLGARVRGELVDAMVGVTGALASSLERRLIHATGELLEFRHELAREALLSVMTGEQRRAWHARALAVLVADPRSRRDELAALAHHAEGAADPVAAREHCVAAAREATRLRAHRQAAEQYERAQRYVVPDDSQDHAALLEAHAHERYFTGELHRWIDLQAQAAGMWHRLGDRVRYGDNLRWLSRGNWCAGRTREARDYAQRAIETLERRGKRRELGAAYSNQAQLCMLADETELAVSWGRKAIALAHQLGDVEIETHALTSVATARAQAGDPAGLRELDRSLDLARGAQLEAHIARALANRSGVLIATRDLPSADATLAEGLAYTDEHGLEAWRLHLRGQQALAQLHAGGLTEAIETSLQLLPHPRLSPVSRVTPLAVLGRARARRGDPEVWAPLDEALALAEQMEELQRIAPVRIARGEAAWLAGDVERARRELEAALPLAQRLRAPWLGGELMFVLALCGERTRPPAWVPPPLALHLRGEFAAAADAWSGLGCRYEQAWSLAGDDSERGLRTAFESFEQLGMRAAAARAADRLRALGVRRIPRGRRAATRANAAGLTTRELEVLGLLAGGLTNADIGRRLFISTRTVDHHVAALLRKLDVEDRAAATRWYHKEREARPPERSLAASNAGLAPDAGRRCAGFSRRGVLPPLTLRGPRDSNR